MWIDFDKHIPCDNKRSKHVHGLVKAIWIARHLCSISDAEVCSKGILVPAAAMQSFLHKQVAISNTHMQA